MSEVSCLFCRIINGEIPGDFVHQDERSVVIRDINAQAPTHLLVIPREHIESLDDASQKDEPYWVTCCGWPRAWPMPPALLKAATAQ